MSRSSLARYAPLMREADPNGAHRIAKQQWHQQGAIVLLPDQIKAMSWQDRELVQAIATRLYGKRNRGNGNGCHCKKTPSRFGCRGQAPGAAAREGNDRARQC